MMERKYNKILILGIIVTLIGAVVIPSISGYNNKISIQSTKENPMSFPLNADYVNAYWKFDECSGNILYDSSGNGYDGTIYGATWESYGSGCTLSFDGLDDYVDFDDHAENYLGFNKTDDLIFSFYFKSPREKGIIYSSCRGDAYGYNPGFHIALNSDGKLQVQAWRLNCGILMNTTSTYNDDSWHFAEIFYNGDSGNPIVDIFVDGTFDSSYEKYVCAFYSDQFNYAQMGRNSDDFSDYFDGKVDEFKIIKYPGGNGQLPPIIDGSTGGVPNIEYDYTFTIVDTEGDDCEINIDFNGYEIGWNGPYETGEVITLSHKWDYEGAFYIRAKSRDIWGESDWSDPFAVEIIENLPPTAPTIEGPSSGKSGESLTYTFTSTDPDGDDISYLVEWGCGESENSDFVPSGEPVSMSHVYGEGTYIISVIAMDINQAESDPSTFQIIVPRTRFIHYMFISRFFQQYPNAFPILQHLLGL